MSNAAKVTVVIPNYNGLKFMEPCFKALEMQICRDFEILVVDNGSGDGSVEWLKEHEIPSIFLETNTGFSGAVNVGIRASKTPYVILLNNDTEPDCHYIGEMIKAIERSPKIFSVSSKMIQLYDHSKMDDAGDFYCVLGWGMARGKGRPVENYRSGQKIFSSCAGAAIYRKSLTERLGGFDEAHFAYLEDMDLSYRAKLAGYYHWYEPEAKVYHVGSGTSGSRYNHFKVVHSAGNNLYLIYKNMPLIQIIVNSPLLLAGFLIKYLFFVKKGLGRDYREGLARGIQLCRSNPDRRTSFGKQHVIRCLAIELELLRNLLRLGQ